MFQCEAICSGKRFQSRSPAIVAPIIMTRTNMAVVRVDILSPFLAYVIGRVETAKQFHKFLGDCFATRSAWARNDRMYYLFSFGILFCAIETSPLMAPRFIVSTAELGTITSAPFSLRPSKSIFIARRCKAVGLSI